MLEQESDGSVNRFGVDNVVVVDNKDEILAGGSDFIEQSYENGFRWRWLRGLEYTQQRFGDTGRDRTHSSDEVAQKACGVVIPFVQRQPGHLPLGTSGPGADQCCLTETGGRRDEGQFALQTLVYPLDQTVAQDCFRRRWRDMEFRGQHW